MPRGTTTTEARLIEAGWKLALDGYGPHWLDPTNNSPWEMKSALRIRAWRDVAPELHAAGWRFGGGGRRGESPWPPNIGYAWPANKPITGRGDAAPAGRSAAGG